MKSLFILNQIFTKAQFLLSCTINWFGEKYQVPWYYVAIPVLAIFLFAYFILMSKTFICPHCNTEFKAKPYQLYIGVHFNGKRLAKCPKCNKKSFCKVKK